MLGKILAIISAALLLVGCAGMSKSEENAAKTAIQYAVMKFIDEDQERADNVVSFVDGIKETVGEENTSLDSLARMVRDRVQWSEYEPAEAMVINNLIDSVKAELETRIDNNKLDPEEQVAVKKVLDWVQEAAVLAGGNPNGAQAAGSPHPHPVG